MLIALTVQEVGMDKKKRLAQSVSRLGEKKIVDGKIGQIAKVGSCEVCL